MKPYLVIDVTNADTDSEVYVIGQGDTRDEAMKELEGAAVVGHRYAEVRILGKLIEPRERKAVTLARVDEEEAPPAEPPVNDAPPEEVEEDPFSEEEVPPPRRGSARGPTE